MAPREPLRRTRRRPRLAAPDLDDVDVVDDLLRRPEDRSCRGPFSTISIARSTPAQKDLGPASTLRVRRLPDARAGAAWPGARAGADAPARRRYRVDLQLASRGVDDHASAAKGRSPAAAASHADSMSTAIAPVRARRRSRSIPVTTQTVATGPSRAGSPWRLDRLPRCRLTGRSHAFRAPDLRGHDHVPWPRGRVHAPQNPDDTATAPAPLRSGGPSAGACWRSPSWTCLCPYPFCRTSAPGRAERMARASIERGASTISGGWETAPPPAVRAHDASRSLLRYRPRAERGKTKRYRW